MPDRDGKRLGPVTHRARSMRTDITTTWSPEGPGPQNQTMRPPDGRQRDKLSAAAQ